MMIIKKRQTHLEYYKQHGIAPVHYDMSSMEAHLGRRESLYSMLGLLPIIFRGNQVLEVAAGTGHNSLFVAAQMPKKYVLLEPNPPAVRHIQDVYANFDRPHTIPEINTKSLEEYNTNEPFDIILCENWLGTSEHELNLLRKLAGFVAPNGVLVVTVVSPIGFTPNLLRRFFVPYLASMDLTFEQRSKMLEQSFSSHLSTLPSMTRNVTDWVHDNMLNPAYFGLCLSAPLAISQLERFFEITGSYPSFVEDWRWFKGLYGEYRRRNEHFIEEYWKKCHNFIDSRANNFPSDPVRNQKLENTALILLSAIEKHEDAHIHGGDINRAVSVVSTVFEIFLDSIPDELVEARLAMKELKPYVANPFSISIDLLAELKHFGPLFGRETSYISLKRL